MISRLPQSLGSTKWQQARYALASTMSEGL
jgi:hypothetical protein